MNNESARLETFKNWPSNAALGAQRVAKAGFYYSGRNLRVVCFSCECFIDDWQYGDQAMARHREANPLCPFVLNPEHSGNIPLLPTTGNSPSPQNTSSTTPTPSPSTIFSSFNHSFENAVFLRESVRLSSFENNWPSNIPISPARLAQAGFYYTNVGDKVQCAFCQGILSHWESGDNPDEEHARHFPHCSLIKNPNFCGNITSSIEPTWNGLAHHGPKNLNYVTYELRLNSYTHWPEKPQKPEQLADAGLYYSGLIDEVRCFHCDGGLKNWLPEDDPWIEHARWFPKCDFVRLRKGETFIHEAMNKKPPNPSLFEKSNEQIDKENIDILMESELVKDALDLGLELNEIRITLENRIASLGESFTSLNDLVDAVLDNKGYNNTSEEQQESTIDAPPNENEEPEVTTPRSISNSHSLPCLQTETISRKANEIHGKSSSLKNINQESYVPGDLEEENRKLKEARTCKICMDAEVGVVYVPCGHLVTCINCAASLEYCPMCRVKIQASVKTYLS